jgi:O-antigen/teichoic acid export membrane protein
VDIEGKVQRAVKWSLGGKMFSQLLSWAVTFYLYKLLVPEDYGLLALGVIAVSFFGEINDFGMESAMIQRKKLPLNLIRAAFGFALVMNVFSASIVYLSAGFIGDYYNNPELIPIVQFTALNLLVGAFLVVPKSQIIRALDGKKRELIYICRNLTLSGVTLILAYLGYGVWSFIYGNLAGLVVAAVLFNIYSPVHCLPIFSYKKVRLLLNYGYNAMAQNITWAIYSMIDAVLLGKYVSTIMLGYYTAGKELANLPAEKFGLIVKEMSLSGLSRFHDDKGAFTYLLLRGIRIMSFALFPVYLGLASVAPELVLFAWGDKWSGLVLPLQILSFVMPLRLFSVPFGQALNALGHPFVNTVNGLIVLAIMGVCFAVGVRYGIVGVSLAWVVGLPISFAISIMRAEKYLGISLWGVVKEFIRPMICAFFMAGGIYLFREYYGQNFENGTMVLLIIFLGIILYLASSAILCRDVFKEMIRFIKR